METSPSASPRATAVTIGNFDGVHQGHQVLIRRALTYSQQFGLDCVVITFWPHPRVLFGRPHQPLTSRAARMRLLQGLGDLRVLELPFTHELAALSPEEFVRQHLLPLRLKHLVIGHDFTLGRGRSGQPDVLRALGEKYGFDVDQLPPVEVGGHVVSSTCLRELIGKGDVATAASLLGHAYGCEGLVVHGEGRGTGLGFPTANIAIPDTMLPAPGVYATRVVVPHLGKTLQAVTNIGRKPTFGDYGLSIESFLLDTDLNLYGNELRLDFVARLRDEKRFESADALVAQIRTDVARARDLLTMYF
ncbi:bifunctional riboflavin kinase/FAD synthetase [Desulfovibrio piger]|uniref:bifunctional riboflavin kinase/FAD synthetase n=1 Tax=Desulfovibrio piger TaxID=901 RepID=UPI0026EB18A4|nr:bifunctional riboflavin kinase/FAD synthetase [Desulfovibrio piger]